MGRRWFAHTAVALLCTLLLLSVCDPHTLGATQPDISLVIDGEPVGDGVSVVVENSRSLIPLRSVVEYLEGKLLWYPQEQQVIGFRGARGFDLTIGSDKAYLCDGTTYTLDCPAQIIAGRTYVPLRFVSEAMGCAVSWDEQARVISITTVPIDTRSEVLALAQPVLATILTDRGTGSGFIYSREGQIITCADTVKGVASIRVRLADGIEYEAETVTVDSVLNLAKLRIRRADGKAFPVFRYFDDYAGVEVGDAVYVAGLGTVTEGTLRLGHISEKASADDRRGESRGGVATYGVSVSISPDDHGGPLLKANGALLGVCCCPAGDGAVRTLQGAAESPYVIPIENVFKMKER